MRCPGNGTARHHGNPEPGHNSLLDPLTALQLLHEVRPVEDAFDHLDRGRACLTENPGLPLKIGERHRRSGGQAVVRGDNEHQRIAPRGLDVELGMREGNADHAEVPLPRQHAVDRALTVGNFYR